MREARGVSEELRGASGLMTSPEAAEYLRLKPSTLQAMRVDGTGPRYFKVGPGKQSKVLYKQEDLDSWLTQFSFQSTSEY